MDEEEILVLEKTCLHFVSCRNLPTQFSSLTPTCGCIIAEGVQARKLNLHNVHNYGKGAVATPAPEGKQHAQHTCTRVNAHTQWTQQ